MNIDEIPINGVNELILRLGDNLQPTLSLEESAQALAKELYSSFPDSMVLARLYAMIPYSQLPADIKSFADGLAKNLNTAHLLNANTPVLTLLGTYGKEQEWCSRKSSKGHVGIPLASASSVQGIPMIARLLHEFGVDISLFDEGENFVLNKVGKLQGIFFVADANKTTDSQGRFVIPAREFVENYGVKTVFGLGGSYLNGTIITAICFTSRSFDSEPPKRFMPLLNHFKFKTMDSVNEGRYFAA